MRTEPFGLPASHSRSGSNTLLFMHLPGELCSGLSSAPSWSQMWCRKQGLGAPCALGGHLARLRGAGLGQEPRPLAQAAQVQVDGRGAGQAGQGVHEPVDGSGPLLPGLPGTAVGTELLQAAGGAELLELGARLQPRTARDQTRLGPDLREQHTVTGVRVQAAECDYLSRREVPVERTECGRK